MADIEDIIRRTETRLIDGRPITAYVVRCEHPGCDAELAIPRPSMKGKMRGYNAGTEHKVAVFIHTIERGVDAAGWAFRRHRSRPFCPDHKPVKPAPKEPAALANTEPTSQPAPRPAAASVVTRGQNQSIHDELDAAYDIPAGRYKGDCSDEKVAKKLNVPRAWVTTMRLALFGEHDRNEAAEDDKTVAAAMDLLAEADAKVKQATDANNRALELVGEAKGDVSRARAMLDGIRRGR